MKRKTMKTAMLYLLNWFGDCEAAMPCSSHYPYTLLYSFGTQPYRSSQYLHVNYTDDNDASCSHYHICE